MAKVKTKVIGERAYRSMAKELAKAILDGDTAKSKAVKAKLGLTYCNLANL